MSRLIDADKLIETIKQHHYILANKLNSQDWGMFTIGIEQAIEEQPTVNEWIPITEQRPYDDSAFLATDGFDVEIMGDGRHTYWFDSLEDVIAWMPIQTYKENE